MLRPGRASSLEIYRRSIGDRILDVIDRALVEGKLIEQAAAIGVPLNDLLDRLAKSVPGFVSILR
jgi:hypothetical protein